jgi:uncharacterized protein DUF4234
MAQEVQIRDSLVHVKLRSPWAVALLPLVTFGIYHLVWWYRVNRELRDFGRARGYDLGDSPTASLLALFPGGIVVVPALVSYWRGTRRVQGAARLAGRDPVNGWICLILYIVLSIGFWAYLQSSLNAVWRTEGRALPGEPALEPVGDGMPQPLPEAAPERVTPGP